MINWSTTKYSCEGQMNFDECLQEVIEYKKTK